MGYMLGLTGTGAAYPLGTLAGIFPAPFVADRLGRRACMLVGACLIIAGGLVQTFTVGGNAMLGGRLVVGLGAAFQVSLTIMIKTTLTVCRESAEGPMSLRSVTRGTDRSVRLSSTPAGTSVRSSLLG
jgi:MFS family permease